MDVLKTSQRIFDDVILTSISIIIHYSHCIKIGKKKSVFMSNYDLVLVNILAIRTKKHIDIPVLWN